MYYFATTTGQWREQGPDTSTHNSAEDLARDSRGEILSSVRQREGARKSEMKTTPLRTYTILGLVGLIDDTDASKRQKLASVTRVFRSMM